MARRLINALAETSRCSSAFGRANAQVLDSLPSMLPPASWTLSGGSGGQVSMLMQQQQYSAGNTHICSQHCSCNLQTASLLTKSQPQQLMWSPASSTRLGIGAGSQFSSSLSPATAARAFASFTGASAHAGCGECLDSCFLRLMAPRGAPISKFKQMSTACLSQQAQPCTCTACTDRGSVHHWASI
jgi:hypothetical protein